MMNNFQSKHFKFNNKRMSNNLNCLPATYSLMGNRIKTNRLFQKRLGFPFNHESQRLGVRPLGFGSVYEN